MARIMVVEDEPITAADLEFKLTALGHDVIAWADTGEEALARVPHLEPDLVLMDIRLRGAMSGVEAAEQLRQQSDVPIVFLTAFADQETVDRACRTLPYGYLLKPFTERSVVTAVQVALSRARADQAQRERERWIAAGMRSTGEALIAVDERGVIRFINEQAEGLLGVKASDAPGKEVRKMLRWLEEESVDRAPGAPAQARVSADPLDLALHEGRVTSSLRRALLPAAKATPIKVSYSAAPVPALGGAKAGAVLLLRELTAQEQDSERPQRAALNALSTRLSHEISNPLTYNLGALQLALRELDQLRALSSLRGGDDDPATARRAEPLLRIERYLREAQQGALRVAGVMRALSSLSANEGERVPLQPVEMLDLAIGLSGVGASEHAQIERQIEPAPVVRGDKWQLARVLADGLQSAVATLEASRPGAAGRLALKVCTDARGWAHIRITGRTPPAAVAVTPQPSALSEQRQASIGMAVMQQMVERHGGELVVHEERDEWVMDLRLPPMSVAAVKSEAPSASQPASERGSVLVIDDEPLISRVLCLSLQPSHDVTSVKSAAEGLALLERCDAFDIILCDLTMPGTTGQDFYERLSEMRPDLAQRVIIMTAGACSERGERFIKQMAGRCLIKPFSMQQLLPLIAEGMRARSLPPAPNTQS